jgi:hypothetical protein
VTAFAFRNNVSDVTLSVQRSHGSKGRSARLLETAVPLDHRLSSWVHPIEWGTFLDSYWQQNPLHIRARDGRLATLHTLLFEFDLHRLLLTAGQERDNCVRAWFLKDDTTDARLRVQPAQGQILYDAGFTLYFEPRADSILRFRDELAASLSYPGTINLSLFAGRKGQKTSAHVDGHENFTVQLVGRKEWRIADPLTPFDQASRVVLSEGDMLYCPGHLRHSVVATEDSLSLNLCCLRSSWAEHLAPYLYALLRATTSATPVPLGLRSDDPAALHRNRTALDRICVDIAQGLEDMKTAVFPAAIEPAELAGQLTPDTPFIRNPLIEVNVWDGEPDVEVARPNQPILRLRVDDVRVRQLLSAPGLTRFTMRDAGVTEPVEPAIVQVFATLLKSGVVRIASTSH